MTKRTAVRSNEEFDEITCDDKTNSWGRTARRCRQDGRVIRIKDISKNSAWSRKTLRDFLEQNGTYQPQDAHDTPEQGLTYRKRCFSKAKPNRRRLSVSPKIRKKY